MGDSVRMALRFCNLVRGGLKSASICIYPWPECVSVFGYSEQAFSDQLSARPILLLSRTDRSIDRLVTLMDGTYQLAQQPV